MLVIGLLLSLSVPAVKGPGRIARNEAPSDIICWALSKAGFPCSKEPVGLMRSVDKFPGGATLTPWQAVRTGCDCCWWDVPWDVTAVDTLADSCLSHTGSCVGVAAELAAQRKVATYKSLPPSYQLISLNFETLGSINPGVHDQGLWRQNEGFFPFQRVSWTNLNFSVIAFPGKSNICEGCLPQKCILPSLKCFLAPLDSFLWF